MNFKKVIIINLILSLILVGGLSLSVNAEPPTPDNPITLEVGNLLSPDSIQNQALRIIKEKVEERTNGAVKIAIFPSEQLGKIQDQFENVRNGIQAMVLEDTPWFQIYSERLKLQEIPFLFTDQEHVDRWMEKVFKEKIVPEILEHGNSIVLTKDYLWRRISKVSPEVLVSKKPVFGPEDMKNLKYRVWPSEAVVQGWKAMGVNICIVDYSEVYLALQYGNIDALDTPFQLVWPQKFTEVAKYLIETNNMFSYECLVINNDIWNKLSSEQQTILQDTINETGKWYNDTVAKSAVEMKEKIIKEHNAAYIQINTEPFVKLSREKAIPELIEKGIIKKEYIEEVEELR